MKNAPIIDTGLYEENRPVIYRNGDNVRTVYRDTAVTMTDTQCFSERKMVVDGKTFYVKSIFPVLPTSTPSQELISLIDTDKELQK